MPYAWGFLLVLFRAAALITVAPVLSIRSIPARVRMGMAVVFATAAYLGAGAPRPVVPETLGQLATHAAFESLLGLLGALGARFLLEIASSAGHIAGLSMGLGYGAQVSPLNGSDSPAVAQLFSMVTLGIAISAGVHREALLWLCRSLQHVPPGSFASLHELGAMAVQQGIEGLSLGARASFPLLVAVTSGHLVMGLAGRFAPQINLQSIGFTVAILAGGASLTLFGPGACELIARATVAALTH